MPVPALRVLIITMNDRERTAVDLLFQSLGWGPTPVTVDVVGERSLEVDRHHQPAQGNLEAAMTVMQSLINSKFDHIIGFGCCGVFDPAHLGKAFLVAGASYQEIGKVGRDGSGLLVVGLKGHPHLPLGLHAHTEIYGDLAVGCDRVGLPKPRQAVVFGVDKVVTALPSNPTVAAELTTSLPGSTGAAQSLDTYLGRLAGFATTHSPGYVPIVDMESYGFLRGADSTTQYLSILRIATDAVEDKNTPVGGHDTDVDQAARLETGVVYLLCLLFALARGGAVNEP